MSTDAEAGCGSPGYDYGDVTDWAADEAIAAAVARLRREAADCVRLAGQARRRDLSELAAKLRDAAGVYERAALIVAARGDVALEPDPERKLPAETIDTGGLL